MDRPFRGRREDRRLVTGQGRYTSDWSLPAELYACFRRSELAHANIRSIDKRKAERVPGVVAVIVGDDVADAGFGMVAQVISYLGRGGSRLQVPDRPVLARKRVRFVGEEVALVVAETPEAAADGAESVAIEYEELPVVVGFDKALASDAFAIHPNVKGNICFDFEYGDPVRTAELISSAAHVTRLEAESPRVAANPMEPRSALAWYDAKRDRFEIRCSHQGGGMMRDGIAQLMGVESKRVRVNMVDVGGGFGPRSAPYPEYALLLFAARQLRRPIKWVSSRSEDFLTDSHGRGVRLTGELALDRDGRFLALRTSWLCDQGAYLTAAGPLTNTINGQLMGAGPYIVQALHGWHRLVMTNATPTNAFRGAGRPEAAYIVERLIDQAAAELGIDPLELRTRNAVPVTEMPYRTLTGTVFDSGDFHKLLECVRVESRWGEFATRREDARRRGKLRGIGVALFLEPSGGGFAPKDQVAIQITEGGQIQLFVGSQSNGQGHETVLPALVADWLGIDEKRVELRSSDPDGPALVGSGTVGSRTTLIQGSALKLASCELVEKGSHFAAGMLEASVDDIEFQDGHYHIRGTNHGVALTAVIDRHVGEKPHPLDTTAELPIVRAFPSGAHVAEVEIDPETGALEVLAYTAVDDIGTVINPVLADGQLRGGVVQGAGQVFGEICRYDEETGEMVSCSFMDYPMPRSGLISEISVFTHSTPSSTNPLGAKGAGEAGTIGSLPALMNAVSNALRPAGIETVDMPITPLRIWDALHRAGKANGESTRSDGGMLRHRPRCAARR